MDRIDDTKNRDTVKLRERARYRTRWLKLVAKQVAFGFVIGVLLGNLAACPGGASQAWQEIQTGAVIAAHDCGSSILPTYNDVRSAIHGGAAGWASVVFDVLGCIEPVVRDELAAHNLLAQLDGAELERQQVRAENLITMCRLTGCAGPIEIYAGDELAGPLPAGTSKGELRRAHIAIAFERAALKMHFDFRQRK